MNRSVSKICRTGILLLLIGAGPARADVWEQATENGRQTQRVIKFCNRYAHGWLTHAEPTSGLFPRHVDMETNYFWDAENCAADNYPFIVLTGEVTGNYYLKLTAHRILEQEQKLCNRLDALPDTFSLDTQTFLKDTYDIDHLIFGASEYAKDGLMPISEWIGASPWLTRMEQLIRDIWKHAPFDSPVGKLPSNNVEVNGEMLQTMSRLYWMTGDNQYKDWCFRLTDYYFKHNDLLNGDCVPLQDHGCEIVGGLSEAYLIAAREDHDRHKLYQPRMYALLDAILQHGIKPDGMMHFAFNPRTGTPDERHLSDGWGYVYNAFLTVALVDNQERYRQAVAHALSNIHNYPKNSYGYKTVDQNADSIEGAINLLNRLPVESAFAWVDNEVEVLFDRQRHDGIIEGWHGDGNSARTLMMYAFWKTQGVTVQPWREDLQLGAVREADGVLRVRLSSEFPWDGRLCFDRPRHRLYFHMPFDYPRINQFPEWFTVEPASRYEIQPQGGKPSVVEGKQLFSYPIILEANKPLLLTVKPSEYKIRQQRYTSRPAAEAELWQKNLRDRLFDLMKMGDLRSAQIDLRPRAISETPKDGYLFREIEINATPGRQIKIVLTLPAEGQGPFPAVVCIHGHGADRHAVYDPSSIYRGFAAALAQRGVVTIAADVGQHQVYESGRTLMGERLWDLMRCVDFLQTLPEVDKNRIGCAGLSLGGEMAMWLAAMDPRIAATVSSGFLTIMDQMEVNHCMCWKFPGLRELVDWADVYSLIAPRALQCQNGLQEGPRDFVVSLARQAMEEIKPIYQDYAAPDRVELAIHPEGHVIDLLALLAYCEKYLGAK